MCNLINLTIESCIGSNERHYEVELTINVSNRTHQSINTHNNITSHQACILVVVVTVIIIRAVPNNGCKYSAE